MNQRAFTVIEVIVAMSITMIILLAISTFFAEVDKQRFLLENKLNISETTLEISQTILKPTLCQTLLGNGYDPAKPYAGKTFDVTVPSQQNITLRDVRSSSAVDNDWLSAYGGSWMTAPATAKIGNQILIRKLTIAKKSDLGGNTQTTYSNGTTVVRKKILAEITIQAEDTRYSKLFAPSKYPIVVNVEQPMSGGAWKIYDCSTYQLPADGWNQSLFNPADPSCTSYTGVQANPPAPYDAAADDPTRLICPAGTYALKQDFIPFSASSSYSCGCGKSGCATCTTTNTTIVPKITCCPSVK